jgi:predicted nuclease of predicted toxin-antitoxin system
MMKFLVDMNMSPRWVGFFAETGFEAVHWSNIGRIDAPDSELLQWAADHGYVVVTADLDFGAILAATRGDRPSVLQIRMDILTPEAIGPAVLNAVRQTHRELLDGALVSVDIASARLRVLPLGISREDI